MRTLLITTASALALIATNASAQMMQSSTIEQIGAANTATVDQTGGEEGVSDILQEGAANLAEVTQSEDPNGSNSFGTPANIADIDQIGDNARARVTQESDAAGGASNVATISQTSNGLPQGTTGVPSGYSMNGRVIQSGSGNVSGIYQSGNPNQPAPGDGSDAGSGVTARNDQYGATNNSSITQDVFLDDANPYSDVDVTQIGSLNVSTVTQRGSDANVDVTQTGTMNTSDVFQGPLQEMNAEIAQTGNDHASSVRQIARTVTALVDQGGSGQTSDIRQLAQSRFAVADVDQFGADNVSDIEQRNVSADAIVRQSGAGDSSIILQTDGADASATVEQAGFGNASTINQTGDMQTASVTQYGSNSSSYIIQGDSMGSGNTATVLQTTDDNAGSGADDGLAGSYGSFISQNGIGNTAVLNQTVTSGNVSSITQMGSANMATVNQ